MSCLNPSPPGRNSPPACVDKFGCPANYCADFEIKRHDTQPSLKVSVEDENGPLDLTNLVLEANMWANAKLKKDITADQTTVQFADNIGFEQVLIDDVIVADRVRSPEYMLITGFDEANSIVNVTRGHNNTTQSAWKKGTVLRVFRFMNQPGVTEITYGDTENIDGTVNTDQLLDSQLVYEWTPNDTCTPGCFWLEFKLIKMLSVVPSTTDVPSIVTTPCTSGVGVDWVRRFPACGELLIHICPSPTLEL